MHATGSPPVNVNGASALLSALLHPQSRRRAARQRGFIRLPSELIREIRLMRASLGARVSLCDTEFDILPADANE